jgi:hypothetical protein
LLGLAFGLQAQPIDTVANPKDKLGKLPNAVVFDFFYGFNLPGGDMLQRYYDFNSAGGHVQWLTGRNWFIGAHGEYQFGERSRLDVVAPLRGGTGEIINSDGNLSDVQLGQRGFNFGLRVTKVFPFNPYKNRRSGLEASLGLGFWQHWIRIRVVDEKILQLQGDYKKGYDRMTNGLMTRQYIGYRYMSRNRYINLFAGVEFSQGFTQNRRPMNYDTRTTEDTPRLDLFVSFKAGLSMPFFIYSVDTDTEDLQFY